VSGRSTGAGKEAALLFILRRLIKGSIRGSGLEHERNKERDLDKG
jgi:hypothetical protein